MSNLLTFKVPVASQEPATPIIGYIERRAMYKAHIIGGVMACEHSSKVDENNLIAMASRIANKLLCEDLEFEETYKKEKKNGHKK